MSEKRSSIHIVQRAIALLTAIAAIALVAMGLYGRSILQSDAPTRLRSSLRVRALLNATGEGAVESYVAAAKKEASDIAKAEGKTMAERREAAALAEEQARANYTGTAVDISTVDPAILSGLSESAAALQGAMAELDIETRRAMDEYIKANADALIEDVPAQTEEVPPETEVALDDLALTGEVEEPKVDLSGFVGTEEMLRLSAVVDQKYQALGQSLKDVYPVLEDEGLAQLRDILQKLVYTERDTFNTEYDRLLGAGGTAAVTGSVLTANVMRHAKALITSGVGLFLIAMLILFFGLVAAALSMPRLIIGGFFVLLCLAAIMLDLSLPALLSNSVVRMGMNSVMVLAMLPAIQCGISLNLGLPLGILGGLIGGLLTIEFGMTGWWGFTFAILVGVAISLVVGVLYGMLLNRLKGSEMAVTTYVGFSVVSLMCIAWLVMPFQSLQLRWPLGTGLRQTIDMKSSIKGILDNTWAFTVNGFRVPTGLLLFMGLCCVCMWLFMRSKTGIAMAAVGNNPRFAEATGINVDKMRIIGTTISTVLGAVGILVYNQSIGFMQLYIHPRTLGLVAASAILIGGASTSRAKISHVLVGTFLFQGVLTLGMPVANAVVPGSTIAETMRILVSNGIILYALTKSGGGSRG